MQFLLRPQCLQSGILNLLISFSFVCAASAANATETKEPAGNLTLQDAMHLALSASPDLAVALREQQATEASIIQAKVRPNPSISTFVQDTRSANRQTTFQLNQELELGNKRDARIESANAFYSKANSELESKRAEVHANVIANFYEVLVSQERLNLAKSSLDVANLALDAAAKRVKAGKSSPVEETKSKIAESSARIEVSLALSTLNASRKKLSSLWGNAVPVFERAEGQVASIPTSVELAGLLAMLPDSPIVKAAMFEVSARETSIKVEQSKSIPNITISAGVLNNQELNGLNQALLGLTVPIPVFDRNQGRVQEAVSRKYKAEDELAALKSHLSAKLASQYERLSASRSAAQTISVDMLPSAQSAFDAANKGFSAGKFNFLDVLDAQRTLFQAKTQYMQVLLDAHLAIAEIERILGDVIKHEPLVDAALH